MNLFIEGGVSMDKEQRKEQRLKLHYEKIDNNLKLLYEPMQLSKYEYLYKVIKRRLRYLIKLIEYSKDKRINDYSTIHDNYYFYVSFRYLARRYKGHTSTWSRNINIFASLGLINKVNIEGLEVANSKLLDESYKHRKAKAKGLGVKPEQIKIVSYYTIPLFNDELLNYANNIAKTMYDNNFKVNGFSKMYLINIFGQEFADNVYDDFRTDTEYSNYVRDEIENYIQQEIKQKGYTTKARVLKNTNINIKKVAELQQYKSKRKENILSREFDRSFNQILVDNDLEYRKANKELKERFNLDTYKFIIYKGER